MRILVTGATGLVGSHLVKALEKQSFDVYTLSRSKKKGDGKAIFYDRDNVDQFEGFDAVVHLAGENIAGWWTKEKKRRIRDSRVLMTSELATLFSSLKTPPKVFVAASAVGYYGNRGDNFVDEESGPGDGFLATLCVDWEKATKPLLDAGIRVVNLRIGVVLSKEGGALKRMLTPFRLGLGGVVGNGKQFMSWIALDDLVQIIVFAIKNSSLKGPVNAVSFNPVANITFTEVLGKVLHRPTVFPLPAFVARMLLGEMADELLLTSTRAQPLKLTQAGYTYLYPDLEEALAHAIQG